MKNQTRTIKKVSTNEINVSERSVQYDCYENEGYVTTFKDICDAIDWRDAK